MTQNTRSLEHHMGDWARARLPLALAEIAMFILKQGWACLFGGLLLLAIIATKLIWQPDWPLHRYDALFLFAIATQALFLATKLETGKKPASSSSSTSPARRWSGSRSMPGPGPTPSRGSSS